MPPVELRFMGESDEEYLAIGDAIADQLRDWAGLADGHHVLDMGCGYGRLPHALKRRGFRGRYLGLDVLARHVRWCRRHLAGWRWRFGHLDVRNSRYNPKGALAAEEVRLQRYTRAADVVVASSLFTHLEAVATRHYLSEFAGLLSPGGRIYASFFVLDARQEGGGTEMTFRHDLGGGARFEYADEPLRAVGYPAAWLDSVFADLGLETRRVGYGTWSQGSTGSHYQDIFILERSAR